MIADRNLSPHFKLSEFLRSQTAARHGIDMTPSDGVVLNLERLCATVLEPVRAFMGGIPMFVSSGYRPPELNRLVGGVPTSAHVDGRAADIVFGQMEPSVALAKLKNSTIASIVDQVIDEFGEWVHFGIEPAGSFPRGQFLNARTVGGHTIYEEG